MFRRYQKNFRHWWRTQAMIAERAYQEPKTGWRKHLPAMYFFFAWNLFGACIYMAVRQGEKDGLSLEDRLVKSTKGTPEIITIRTGFGSRSKDEPREGSAVAAVKTADKKSFI